MKHYICLYLRHNLESHPEPQDALRVTLEEVGNALMMTSIVVMFSFSVFLLSHMSNIRSFGSLMMAGVIFALLVDIILMPAMMLLPGHQARTKRGVTCHSLRKRHPFLRTFLKECSIMHRVIPMLQNAIAADYARRLCRVTRLWPSKRGIHSALCDQRGDNYQC